MFWINKWYLTSNRWLDFIIVGGFSIQGLLTFSRGGMIGGVIGISVIIWMNSQSSKKNKKRFKLSNVGKFVLPGVIGLYMLFQIADGITGGILSLRYSGETNSTLSGRSEVDLNTLTTGRFDIFLEDLEIWSNNVFFGVGVGGS